MPISVVIDLSKSGAAPTQVAERMRTARTTYAPRGSDFGKLADLGVAPSVLDDIQTRFVNEVEMLTRYAVLGESLGGCSYCFPQPLDLGNLAKGGNGMAAAPTGNYTGGGRPPGVPTWVPASPGIAFEKAPGLTVDEIAQRAKAGEPAEALARQIRHSRLDNVIATGGWSNVTTRAAVGLSGSKLAGLHQQGVPDVVLDALQEQYLAQFIEFQRQRYKNWGKGPAVPN